MVQRTYPQARTHQPADPTAADSQGLIFAWHGGRLLQDSVRGAPLSTVGYAGMGRTDRGVGPSLNGSSGSINTQLKFTAAEGSIALLTYLPSAIAGSTCMATQSSDDAGSGCGLGWQNGAARIRGGFDIAYSGNAFPAGLHLFEIDWTSSAFTAYLDGASVGSNSYTGGSPNAPTGAYYFEIGCFSYSGGRLFFSTQTPLLFAAWNRTRTAREHERMWRKPWEIFRPAQRRVPVSAGVQSRATGRADETDTAFALSTIQARATGRADEADTAFALAALQQRATGRADEADSAFALAGVQSRAAGRADETDTAYALSLGGTAVPVGRADEADTAYALAQLQIIGTGRADEVDTAYALSSVQVRATGRADETDTAFALAAVQVRATGRADETDVAYALSLGAEGTVGVATESDSAFALTAVQIRATGLATETDTAYALGATATRAVGLATETDTAYALSAVQIRATGRADETETAFALSPLLLLTAGLSLEIDTSFALVALQARLVGRADELDQAAVPGGTFGLAHVISPRLWVVPSERRYYAVPSENRAYAVPSEDRGTAP